MNRIFAAAVALTTGMSAAPAFADETYDLNAILMGAFTVYGSIQCGHVEWMDRPGAKAFIQAGAAVHAKKGDAAAHELEQWGVDTFDDNAKFAGESGFTAKPAWESGHISYAQRSNPMPPWSGCCRSHTGHLS